LEEAKKYGTKLITIVARDENVIKLKNQAPLNDENIRLQNIKNL
jgi:glycerol-3-phosphate cytidylyltransferase-like family protein